MALKNSHCILGLLEYATFWISIQNKINIIGSKELQKQLTWNLKRARIETSDPIVFFEEAIDVPC